MDMDRELVVSWTDRREDTTIGTPYRLPERRWFSSDWLSWSEPFMS